MPKALPEKQDVLDAIRSAAQKLGHPPSRTEFKINSGMSEYQVLRHFPSWREAVRAAGLEPDPTNIRLTTPSSKIGAKLCGRIARFQHAINTGGREASALVHLRNILGPGRQFPPNLNNSVRKKASGLM